MAKLTAAARRKIPTGSFAGPDRSYPIEDESHAKAALQRGAQHAGPELLAKIKAKVRRKYPSMDVKRRGGAVVEGKALRHRLDRRHRGGIRSE